MRGSLAVFLAISSLALAGEPSARVRVEGTAFRVSLPDGRTLTGDQLVGMQLTVADDAGVARQIRIDGQRLDPEDPAHEIVLYDVSVKDSAGAWTSFCQPGPDGLRAAFPLAGTWTADMRHLPASDQLNLTCTSGAIGKCVRWGYKPWKNGSDGKSLWDAHQACVRMVRADYCGDGIATTRNGMRIDVSDPLGIQVAANEAGMAFEAAWGTDGALCVHHVRVPENTSLDKVLATCPQKLSGHTGAACTEQSVRQDPRLKLMNRSAPGG